MLVNVVVSHQKNINDNNLDFNSKENVPKYLPIGIYKFKIKMSEYLYLW